MSFIADKQTLEDLNLLGKYKSNSVYSLFNKVRTEGGEKLLDQMFRHPLTDAQAINQRSRVFQYFGQQSPEFPFGKAEFVIMENYLGSGSSSNKLAASLDTFRKNFLQGIGLDHNKEYQGIVNGLHTTIALLNTLHDFITRLEATDPDNPFREEIRTLRKLFSSSQLRWLPEEKGNRSMPLMKIVRYDNLLRHTLREEMTQLLHMIYQIDVYIAVSGVAKTKGYAYAHALPATAWCIRLAG